MNVNDVYRSINDSIPLQGLYRVLWVDKMMDEVVLIPIPDLAAEDKRRYFLGPKSLSYSTLRDYVLSGCLIKTTFRLAGIFTMSDKKLAERYPSRKGVGGNILYIRDKQHRLIKNTVESILSDRQSFFANDAYKKTIPAAARKAKCAEGTFRNALNRYLALGCGKSALLPFSHQCGAPGKERDQKHPLGNTSKAFKAGLIESAGYVLSYTDKEKLGWGYHAFMRKDGSVQDAYDQTMALFWSDGDRIVDGQAVPVLLPSHGRPTLDQFKYWAPRLFDNEEAWRVHLGFQEFESNYRAYVGSAMDGVAGIGQFGLCDATSIDDQLVSRFSRLDPIGSATRMIILDAFSTIITGFHLGLNAPSEEIALLSVLSSATSKVDYCSRYGVEITDAEFPAVYSGRYIVDNGEFRTKKVRNILTANDSGMELVRVHRGDMKPHAEAMHRTLHKKTGHRISGTTRGRQRKRGEEPPAVESCWTIDERIRLDLQAIRHINTSVAVQDFFDNHPFRSQMKADGVRPYRADIHAWGIEQGLVYSPPFHEDKLRAALLPKVKAVIKENGLHLLRPDCGRRSDLIKGPRFSGPRLFESGLMGKARRGKVVGAFVHANMNDLTHVWYADDTGFHRLENRSSDIALTRTGTVQDCLAIQNRDTAERELDRGRTDQARTEFVSMRQTNDAFYASEKQKEIAEQYKRPSKASLASGQKANRAREIASMRDPNEPRKAGNGPVRSGQLQPEPRSPDLLDAALKEHRDAP